MAKRSGERSVRIDPQRLNVAMAVAGIQTDRELAGRTGLDTRTLVRVRDKGTLTFSGWNDLAKGLNCNPIDLIVTEGHPDPKMGKPGRTFKIEELFA